jgi:hypothetical protein
VLIEKQVCDFDAAEVPTGFRFAMKVADYGLLKSLPRGRYMLTGRLFVAGLDSLARQTKLRPEAWL